MHEGPTFSPFPHLSATQSLLDAIGGSKGFADIKPFGAVETVAVLESTQKAKQILASPPQQPPSGP